MAHARAKLTPVGRLLLVDRILEDGWRPADAARAMGVSRATAYKWMRRFRSEGPIGLVDRSSAPRRCPHRLSELEVAAIVAARLDTMTGPHRLAYRLGRHRSTIYGVLRREGVSRLAWIDRPTHTVVRYERARPGELIHVDVNPQNLGRNVPAHVTLCSDARVFLDRLLVDGATLRRPACPDLWQRIHHSRQVDRCEAVRVRISPSVDPMFFMSQFRCALGPDELIFVDVTAATHWASEVVSLSP